MKNLLIVALTLSVVPAFAAKVVIKNKPAPANADTKLVMTVTAKATTKYTLNASNLYLATSAKTKADGTLIMISGGQTVNQAIPTQESSPDVKGYIKILSNSEVEFKSEGEALKLKAEITRNAQGGVALLKVSDKEFAKAARALMAAQGEQMRQIQDNPIVNKIELEVSSLTCTGQAGVLTCDQKLTANFQGAQ